MKIILLIIIFLFNSCATFLPICENIENQKLTKLDFQYFYLQKNELIQCLKNNNFYFNENKINSIIPIFQTEKMININNICYSGYYNDKYQSIFLYDNSYFKHEYAHFIEALNLDHSNIDKLLPCIEKK